MTVYRYGAFARNWSTAQSPSLTCPRDVVDIYSTTTASGGNGQLSKPTALLTEDEASFVGSGHSTATNGSTYSRNSYLCSGSDFWLLSPNYRDSDGSSRGSTLGSDGRLGDRRLNASYGMRPAISLIHSTTVASGSGTATDPWIISPPEN